MRPAQQRRFANLLKFCAVAVSGTSSLAPQASQKRTSSYPAAGTRTDAIAGQEAARDVASASVRQYRTGQLGRAERIINLPEWQQIGTGGVGGTVDLQHETAVDVEPRRVGFLLIRWVRRDGPRTHDISC